MKDVIDMIVKAFEAEDYEIVYRYRNGILLGQTKIRPEDDEDIIGINGRGHSRDPKFPDTEIDIDLRNGNIITFKNGYLFSMSDLNEYDTANTNMMRQLISDLDRDGFFDPVEE